MLCSLPKKLYRQAEFYRNQTKKEQSFFIDCVFGKKEKNEGILDAWGKRELRARLDSIKDDLNKKEREFLKKDDDYQSQFGSTLTRTLTSWPKT